MPRKAILAYSGGLDTSVAIPWIKDHYDCEVVALTVDVGQDGDMDAIREKALNTGAIKIEIIDAKERFVSDFVTPALQAGALYEKQYPLATALSRPLIAEHMVDLAIKEKAFAVAHGCTGKGNDQVRIEVSVQSLAPELEVIAPAREWGMNRIEEKEYAVKMGIPVQEEKGHMYSIDENLWGRSIEGEDLEDPWSEPTEAPYAWTKPIDLTPEAPQYVEISFTEGVPAAIDGKAMSLIDIINYLNVVAGEHGVGRIDHVENRLVGIKSREIYEAPAAVVLNIAHQALEALVLSKEQLRFKEYSSQIYADLIYNGLWFTGMREDLYAYVKSTQRYVEGVARIKLIKGNAIVVGRSSPNSLYSKDLATYSEGDKFDQESAEGFIKLFGLSTKTEGKIARRNSPKS